MDKKAISNDSWLYLYEFLKNEFIFRDLWKARECTLNMYLAANHTKQHTGQRKNRELHRAGDQMSKITILY